MRERYANELRPDEYSHCFHAGNVGDVWKHTVLLSVLDALFAKQSRVHLLDCYAGHGRYALASTGEWTEGVGALAARQEKIPSPAVQRYLNAVVPGFQSEHLYLGSPALIRQVMREGDRLDCYDTSSQACRELTSVVSDKHVSIYESDGLAALQLVSNSIGDSNGFCALIDPPWVKKQDWQVVPQALLSAWRRAPQATFLLWYPIKSFTRINAMMKLFEAEKLPATVFDLVTTPLEHQRNRLNGSGMLVVNALPHSIAEICEAAAWIGKACATRQGYWTSRVTNL